MTTIVKELRDALIDAGASPEKADAAAQAVIDMSTLSNLVTKADLYQALLIQTAATVALVAAVVKFLP